MVGFGCMVHGYVGHTIAMQCEPLMVANGRTDDVVRTLRRPSELRRVARENRQRRAAQSDRSVNPSPCTNEPNATTGVAPYGSRSRAAAVRATSHPRARRASSTSSWRGRSGLYCFHSSRVSSSAVFAIAFASGRTPSARLALMPVGPTACAPVARRRHRAARNGG